MLEVQISSTRWPYTHGHGSHVFGPLDASSIACSVSKTSKQKELLAKQKDKNQSFLSVHIHTICRPEHTTVFKFYWPAKQLMYLIQQSTKYLGFMLITGSGKLWSSSWTGIGGDLPAIPADIYHAESGRKCLCRVIWVTAGKDPGSQSLPRWEEEREGATDG